MKKLQIAETKRKNKQFGAIMEEFILPWAQSIND